MPKDHSKHTWLAHGNMLGQKIGKNYNWYNEPVSTNNHFPLQGKFNQFGSRLKVNVP